MARAHPLVVTPPTDQERDALNILLAQLALVLIVSASIRPGNLEPLPNTLTITHALLKGSHHNRIGAIPSHRGIPLIITALDPLATARTMRNASTALLEATPVITALTLALLTHRDASTTTSATALTLALLTHRDAPTTTSATVDNVAMLVALTKKIPIPTSVITETMSSVLNTVTALPSKAPSSAARSVSTASPASFNVVNAFQAMINRTVVPHNLILATHAGKANKQRIVTTRSAADHRTLMSAPLMKKLNLKETTS